MRRIGAHSESLRVCQLLHNRDHVVRCSLGSRFIVTNQKGSNLTSQIFLEDRSPLEIQVIPFHKIVNQALIILFTNEQLSTKTLAVLYILPGQNVVNSVLKKSIFFTL